ncbi:phytoene/squalene synthase family protein [Paracraurococcus ruber]|uniref:Phytoene synthase n=1 Tax=Paracraurococcus ruber TaxID=77675 RepID=A0ABS1CWA8_9PROT|nr:phytoene/squalene synthase family protein [Paracraurococcus ruber]MBK1658689.1 phytoene synthase [Paracraurococcus ruber]TDG32227.1 phytoene/squalene synthase family protein [Paracraurococcus ruber]
MRLSRAESSGWSAFSPVLSAADLADCRTLLAGGSKSFHAASKLLPRSVAEPATALYAFCRVADDAIDLDPSPAALAMLQDRLARACEGRPLPLPADRALAAVVTRYAIPRAVPEALLDGFAWDRQGRRYETLSDLTAYAARVAGTVGIMMALLMGERRPAVLARAADLGVAMQFSNIARDVGEDARAGRLYLPLEWLREAGLDPEAWLAAPGFDARIGRVVARLLAEAAALYRRSEAGIARLPLACRPGIGAARWIYAEIGHEVARNGHDSVSRRAVVSHRRKLALLARSLGAIALPAGGAAAPCLPETQFLVEAVAAAPRQVRVPVPEPGTGARVAWMFELFEQIEQDRALGRGTPAAE